MTKIDFINDLRAALQGEIPDQVIVENLRFYEHYIKDEMQKGRSEEAVMAELGSPRLIAKTIMETWQSKDTDLELEAESREYTGEGTYWNGDQPETDRFQKADQEKVEKENDAKASYIHINGKKYRTDAWYMKMIPILVAVLIVVFLGWLISGMLHLTFSLLTSPIFWIILAVVILFNWFRWK